MIVTSLNNKFLKALAMLGLLLFCSCDKKVSLIHLSGRTMGTQYNVKYFTKTKLEDKVKTQQLVDELLKKVNKEMSTYLKDSEISYFNQTDRLGWLKISSDFFKVTSYALQLAHESEGAFDPTIGPLVNLWGFGPGGIKKVPTAEEIDEALKRVGYDKINLNKERSEIKKKVPGVYLDLSALAKGFGVDKVGEFLENNGIENYMVEIGGEVRTKGRKEDNSSWKIAIEAPHPTSQGEAYQRVLNLDSLSLATSGNYRNFFMENGKKYSHTINVKTGKPVAHSLASVSVADSKSCMKADALATALMAMGQEKGFEYAEKNDIAAYFVYREDGQEEQKFVTRETKKFKELFLTKNVSSVP